MIIRFALFLLMASLTLQACTPAGPDKANLAMVDLSYARQLDPGNRDIIRLLQICAVARRQQGDTSPLFEDLASPASDLGIMLPEGVTTEIPPDLLPDLGQPAKAISLLQSGGARIWSQTRK